MDGSSSVLQALRRESLDIYNRLHSIADDAQFVAQVHASYPTTPLVPNLRCGAWYADPAIASTVPAYFKSTDGHFNNWSFNLRRPNLQLLPLIAEYGSVILVDSTRAGKRIPDALSKTAPIWCAAVSRAIARRFPSSAKDAWDTALYTPPGAVSAQEHHQITQRIDAWAEALFKSSFDLPDLAAPLRPFWITPATTTFPALPDLKTSPPPFLPVLCLSASRQSDDARRPSGFAYIQGSGDDHELWSMGLTHTHYWRHTSALLAASRQELPQLIQELVASDTGATPLNPDAKPVPTSTGSSSCPTTIKKTGGRMKLCTFFELHAHEVDRDRDSDAYVLLPSPTSMTHTVHKHTLTLPLAPKSKTHLAQTLLPRALAFIGAHLAQGRNVCVVCGDVGIEDAVPDEGVAVLLAALVVFFDWEGMLVGLEQKGEPRKQETDNADEGERLGGVEEAEAVESFVVQIPGTDKARIRTRLEWIIACRAGVNPARATLKRVNEFFMSGGRA
ncbi:hypothetical protein H0H81_008126 [Sphagnurus paluster]|uniref:Initiator tRNA phosphoribosyl transferase n=1 Tax=Sphagnurus paluster TaxID=117069 RepID=A0A9P7K373_9AGAR|nr:hypothetical protein H0H81_008126 [Sphagnurus paluster]